MEPECLSWFQEKWEEEMEPYFMSVELIAYFVWRFLSREAAT
jgi:hypothetical protein